MDAFLRSLLLVCAFASLGAGYRTPNFVITAHNEQFAKQIGEAAEVYRKELAIEWLGAPLPGNWSSPCPIEVVAGNLPAQGSTTFNFQNGEVYGWRMKIEGSEQRLLDSVLPHEINHTIFASYFRRPLPRWADEGAASLIEHGSERLRLQKIHRQVMGTSTRIPLRTLLEMKNYPRDKEQVLAMYAEGHSLADYLIQRSDKSTFLKFLECAHDESWPVALKKMYQYDGIEALEKVWDKWVMAGSPALMIPTDSVIADNSRPAKTQPTVRGQSPDTAIARSTEPSQLEEPLDVARPGRTTGKEVAAKPLSRDGLEIPLLTQEVTISGAARLPTGGLSHPVLTR